MFNVTLMKNMYNKAGILGSKATGEPPYVLANSVFFATKKAIDAARSSLSAASASASSGVNASSQWGAAAPVVPYMQLSAPLTVDQRQQACMADVLPQGLGQGLRQGGVPSTKKLVLPY